MTVVKDGSGAKFAAKVDEKNRLRTLSIEMDVLQESILEGNTFIFNSSVINLTSDCESALLYFRNDDERDLYVELINLVEGDSNACGEGLLKIVINPTGGTIVTTATPAINFNTNIASANTFDGVVYSGFEGATATGSPAANPILTRGPLTELRFGVRGVLPRGTTAALTYTPPTGNTSMNVQILAVVYSIENDLR